MSDKDKIRVKVYYDIRELVRKLQIDRKRKEIYTLFLSQTHAFLKKEGKTFLHSNFIKFRLGKNYLEDLNYLTENGIISRGKLYTPSLESKRFTIKGKISEKKVDMRIDRDVRAHFKKKFILSDFPEIELNKLNLGRIALKSDNDSLAKINFILQDKESNVAKKLIILQKAINAKKKRITKKHESSRMFHFVSNTMKGLRYLLTVDGEELEEMDMSSAHYFFLGQILSIGSKFKAKAELSKFKQMVSNGEFYSFIQKKLQLDNSKYSELKTVKSQLLIYLYTHKNKYFVKRANGSKMVGPAFRDVFDTMKAAFPNIHDYIISRSGTDISDDLNYQETNTMLRKFAKLVKSNYPDLFYVNIHDAVLYKTSDRPKIEKILGDIFKSNKPKFKVENLKSEFNKMMEAKKTPRRSKKIKEKMIETLNIKLNKENEIISFKLTWMKKIGGTKKALRRDVLFLKSLTPNPKKPASSLRLNITKAELNNLQPKIQRNQVQILIERAA